MDNLVLNNLSTRVVALNVGLSDKEGDLTFTSDENCTNHVVADDEAQAERVRVPVRSLDSVLSGERPTVIKIDVEGFETSVLDGAKGILADSSLHSVIMELNGSGARYGFDETAIVRTMTDFGFSTYEYEPFSRQIRPLYGKNDQLGNTLFLRNLSQIREVIAKAPPVTIGRRYL